MIRLIVLLLVALLASVSLKAQSTRARPNVVLICIDDLRPELGCYGNAVIRTPNLDRLASHALLFENHYVQVPTCGASRFNLLTGMRPTNDAHLRNDAIERFISSQPESPRPESFIHALRRNGYHTVGIGKISHSADGLLYPYTGDPSGAKRELPYSWDELLFNAGKWGTGWNAFFGYADGSNRQSMHEQVRPYEKGAVDDEGYPDGLTANLAVEKIADLARQQKPFFLGVGFFKPHLPFNAPEQYWDWYDESTLPMTGSPDLPVNVNPASLHGSNEFNRYRLGDEKASLSKPLSEPYARKIIHAYYAAISYVDAQVGKVLNALEVNGLSDNTIVIVWGDHGWHLGDHRVWGKHTLFEAALRSPLIIRVPGMKKPGRHTEEIVSTIDLYPTLMELCGIPLSYEVDGKSFSAIFFRRRIRGWEGIAYSYFNNGVTMRNKKYRLTRYSRKEEPVVELYNHRKDPFENRNIADQHPRRVKVLSAKF